MERDYSQELDDSIAALAEATARFKRTVDLTFPTRPTQPPHCWVCGHENNLHYSKTHESHLCEGCRVDLEREWVS